MTKKDHDLLAARLRDAVLHYPGEHPEYARDKRKV